MILLNKFLRLRWNRTNLLPVIASRTFLLSADNKFLKNDRVIKKKLPIDDIGEWIPIYRFPYIVPCRIFARAKLYMTMIMTTVLPASYIFTATSYNMTDSLIIFGISGFSLSLLYGFGQLFRRLIGSVYITPNKDLVRISHLTFFGNRAEKIIPSEDLLLLADCNSNLNDLVLRVQTINDNKNALFICLKFGGILDAEKFINIFGKI